MKHGMNTTIKLGFRNDTIVKNVSRSVILLSQAYHIIYHLLHFMVQKTSLVWYYRFITEECSFAGENVDFLTKLNLASFCCVQLTT